MANRIGIGQARALTSGGQQHRPNVRLLHIDCADPQVQLTVEMGDGPATPSAGMASWEVIDRVEDKSLTDRIGKQPFQQDVPIVFDGYAPPELGVYREGDSVQRDLDRLLSLGGAVFRVSGPVHRPNLRYIFGGDPDFGETIRDDDETLLRQRLTLKLMEFVDADVIRRRKRHAKRKAKGSAATGGTSFPGTRYTVKAGDTLQKIAAALYGDWKQWKSLGAKNGIRDPFKQLEPGRTLKL